jgi:large subunit ribosomal protein L20
MKYSTLMGGLNRANVEVNRKMLAEMAITDPATFSEFVDIAQEALATEA